MVMLYVDWCFMIVKTERLSYETKLLALGIYIAIAG